MAKKTGKKAGKSGKTDPVKRPGAERSKAPKATPSKKKVAVQCDFCSKPLKDEKTKKIHERSCKAKKSEQPAPKQNGFESALIELKDRFEDDRQSMAKSFQDREDKIQRELEEVKTVLRLEMDRHRKELERLNKVERDVAETHVPAPVEDALPEAKPVPAESAPEPQRARSQQPRAIDLIPMHVPPIPRRKFPEERDPIPDLDDYTPKKSQSPALDRAAMEEMVREMVEKFRPEPGPVAEQGAAELKVGQVTGKLELLEAKLEKRASELAKSIERATKEMELKRMEKDLERVSERVLDMMEDSGYGESLSVSKIPPTILEIVYQAILDDIHIEIIRTKGAQDAERIARSALEEVRLKTSGSELFKFDGRKIVTDSLARSIEANLISARQIQTTYDVLLDKLLETVPHHKAKNFKGMIKVKSQEFAVDRATRLTKDVARLEKVLESTSQMVAAMSANFNAQNLDIHEKLKQISEGVLVTKASVEDVSALGNKLEETNERCMKLGDDLALLRTEMEMKASIREKAEADEAPGDMLLAPGEEPFIAQQEVPEGGVFTAQTSEPDPDASAVLEAVAGGAGSKTAIVKKTGLAEPKAVEMLAALVQDKKVIEKKSGKRVRYTTLEREMEKAKEGIPAKPGKKEPAAETREEAEGPRQEPGVTVLDDSPETPAEEETVTTVKDAPADVVPTPGVIVLDDAPESPEEPAPEPEPEAAPEPAMESPPEVPHRPRKKRSAKPAAPEAEQEKKQRPASRKKDKGPSKPENVGEGPAPKKKPKPETTEPEPEGGHVVLNDFPVVKKPLSELSKEEGRVLDSVTEAGVTLTGIQSRVGKGLKRFQLLRALRVLIDSGHVEIVPKGRMELYRKMTVTKMDKPKEEKDEKEVK